MKANPTRSALVLIDMENGFVNPQGGHCIRGAASTVPVSGPCRWRVRRAFRCSL